MLHHISISVSNIEMSTHFYDALLEPLGYYQVSTGKNFVGYGVEKDKDIFAQKKRVDKASPPSPGFHIAFSAPNRASVDQAYTAGIESGGKDNGAPGIRENYGSHYYAAFLVDPDGYEVEIVIN